MIQLNPYLSFRDNARQAMEFYHSVFGGELQMDTFKEYQVSQDPAEDNKIMHAMLRAANGVIFMAADTPDNMEYQAGSNISLSLSGEDEPELRDFFEKLSNDGEIIMPLEEAPWGAIFGMLRDPFGVEWMVNISAPQQK
jgi:PhnB protein